MAVRDGTIENMYLQVQHGIISRRQFVRGLLALGVSAGVIGELVPGVGVAEAAHGIPGPRWQGGKRGGTPRASYTDPIGGVPNPRSRNRGPAFPRPLARHPLLLP